MPRLMPPRPLPPIRSRLMTRLLLPLLALAAAAALPAPAAAQFVAPDQRVVVGRPVDLQVPAGTDTVRVTYRPNSAIGQVEALPVTAATVRWTPREAGVVALAGAGGAAQNVSVRFEETPALGLLMLTLAGLILFGGATFAFIKLFSGGSPPRTAPEVRPDT